MDEARLAALTGHTPKPWTCETNDEFRGPDDPEALVIMGPGGYEGDPDNRRIIADVTLTGSGLPDDEALKYAEEAAEDEANARLMAAAPELRDEVQRLRDVLEGLIDEQNGVPLLSRVEQYRAAYAAACECLGRTPATPRGWES